jgi:hypothetical protein
MPVDLIKTQLVNQMDQLGKTLADGNRAVVESAIQENPLLGCLVALHCLLAERKEPLCLSNRRDLMRVVRQALGLANGVFALLYDADLAEDEDGDSTDTIRTIWHCFEYAGYVAHILV